jgi:carboxylesterase
MLIALVVLGVIAGLAAIPIDTKPLRSNPHPVAEYSDAIAVFDSLRADEAGRVMRDGASLLFTHGSKTPRAIVLIHGLTNSPRQFRELGQQLYERGYNVIVPRLPEHGLEPADISHLKTLTAEKFRDYEDRAIDLARGLGDSVFAIGLSAGGNVAAWIAQHRPDVARVIVIAPAITVARIPGLLDAPVMNLMERVPNISIHQRPDSGRGHAYFGTSTRGLAETLRFGATIMSADGESPAVRDITVVINDNDHTVDQGPPLHLVASWQREGVVTTTYRFDRSLRLPHDIIDVTQRCGVPDAVYPALIALLEKQPVVIDAAARC